MFPSPSATGRLFTVAAGYNYVQRGMRFIEFTKH